MLACKDFSNDELMILLSVLIVLGFDALHSERLAITADAFSDAEIE